MIKFSNPRMNAEIQNWPHGSQRVVASFHIEKTARGERAVRVTTGKPKALTYSVKQRIVDGDDGRTYIACFSPEYGMIKIMQGDMKFMAGNCFDGSAEYAELIKLFD